MGGELVGSICEAKVNLLTQANVYLTFLLLYAVRQYTSAA